MAIASEILNTTFVAEAEVVTSDSTVIYDDPLLQDLKQFTVEELYEKLDQEITRMYELKKPHEGVVTYLSELYRRGISLEVETGKNIRHQWWEYDVVRCDGQMCQISCPYRNLTIKEEHLKRIGRELAPDEIRSPHHLCVNCSQTNGGIPLLSKEDSILLHQGKVSSQLVQVLRPISIYVKHELTKLKKIKAIHLASLKKPLVYEDINDLMDAILDANGNKISAFKDYLSPEHYRIIRAGRDVSEIKEQDELLRCLRIMKSEIKK